MAMVVPWVNVGFSGLSGKSIHGRPMSRNAGVIAPPRAVRKKED
jgi:hypothetical protein